MASGDEGCPVSTSNRDRKPAHDRHPEFSVNRIVGGDVAGNGGGKIFDKSGELERDPRWENNQPKENHDDCFAIPPEKRYWHARTFSRYDHFSSGSEQVPTTDSNT